ncbi:MAG: response regulator, partial [Methanolinea sp.]|nr:response regulator [Methanolinea sp.]
MIDALYVDDELTLLDLCKIFLERDPEIRVHTAPGVDEAFRILEREPIDVVISDYQMPDKDGIEFLKEFRASRDNRPFILFTGRGREEVVIDAINSGVDFYLQKGGDPRAQFAELSHKIRQAISRKRAEESLQRKHDELGAAYEHLAASEEELRQNYEELSQSQRALQESERRLSDIIEFLPDATFAIDAHGRVIAWNHAIEEMTGIPADRMIGK